MTENHEKYEKVKAGISCEIKRSSAQIFLDLKKRGLVPSAIDAIVHGLTCFYEKVLLRVLQEAQLKVSRKLNEEF